MCRRVHLINFISGKSMKCMLFKIKIITNLIFCLAKNEYNYVIVFLEVLNILFQVFQFSRKFSVGLIL